MARTRNLDVVATLARGSRTPVQHRSGTDRAALVALAHHDVPASFLLGQTRQLTALAHELEQLVPAAQRGGHVVSLCGQITLYVVGELDPTPALIAGHQQVRVVSVARSRAEVEQASALAWEHVPDELRLGVLSDWFDPEINGLRVEVAPWFEGTAAQLARHLGVPVEVSVCLPAPAQPARSIA